MTKNSGIGKINANDFWKGALMVCFGHLTAIIIFLLRQDHWPTWKEWQPYIEVTITTFLTYVGAKFGFNNEGEFLKQDKTN